MSELMRVALEDKISLMAACVTLARFKKIISAVCVSKNTSKKEMRCFFKSSFIE